MDGPVMHTCDHCHTATMGRCDDGGAVHGDARGCTRMIHFVVLDRSLREAPAGQRACACGACYAAVLADDTATLDARRYRVQWRRRDWRR